MFIQDWIRSLLGKHTKYNTIFKFLRPSLTLLKTGNAPWYRNKTGMPTELENRISRQINESVILLD